MDSVAFKSSIVEALKEIPPNVALDLARPVLVHFQVIREKWPIIKPKIDPLWKTATIDMAAGFMDKDGLEKIGMEAVSEYFKDMLADPDMKMTLINFITEVFEANPQLGQVMSSIMGG